MSFTRVYFPVLPAMLAVQATQSFLRAQRIVKPVTQISVVAAVINLPVTWACVTYYGFIGAPLAQVIGAWVLLAIYLIYFRWTGVHKRCWAGWSRIEALRDWGALLRLGAAGMAGNVGMSWSWQIMIGIAGTLGTAGLAAHACLTSMVMLYWQWIGCTTIATTIRVGNHLGAGDAYRAKCAALVPAVFLPVVIAALWLILMLLRDQFAFAYATDSAVAALAATVLPYYLYTQSCSSIAFGCRYPLSVFYPQNPLGLLVA